MEEDIEYITFDGDVITKSDIRDEIINKYISANLDGLTKITDFSIGSEAYHLADVIASYVLEQRELIDLNYRMSMVHYAEGEFLDNFGDMVGVHRNGASPSVGEVTFTRLSAAANNNIIIADGTQISTDDAISFIVDNDGEDLVLEAGVNNISCNVICEQEGSYTNVLPNSIVLVMGDLGSFLSVTNNETFTGGTDIEEDEDYRARILLSPYGVPTGSLQWYEDLSNELVTVHDTLVMKGTTSLDADVIINFNPADRNEVVTRIDLNNYNEDNSIESTATGVMTKARQDLIELFSMKEYDIVGVTKQFHLANEKIILRNTLSIEYIFGVVLEPNYTLDMIKENVISKITDFNKNASIGIYFNPNVLAAIIENEIEGINLCKIISFDGSSYSELVEPIPVDETEIFSIDLTDISDKIKLINKPYDNLTNFQLDDDTTLISNGL